MTTVIYHDLPGVENSFLKLDDFPGCVGTLLLQLPATLSLYFSKQPHHWHSVPPWHCAVMTVGWVCRLHAVVTYNCTAADEGLTEAQLRLNRFKYLTQCIKLNNLTLRLRDSNLNWSSSSTESQLDKPKVAPPAATAVTIVVFSKREINHLQSPAVHNALLWKA